MCPSRAPRANWRPGCGPSCAGSKKAGFAAGDLVVAGPLTLWPARRASQWQGQPLELTGTEFNLLLVLARQAGQVVARNELSEQGMGRPLARSRLSIDVHVSSLRQELGPRPDGEPWIVRLPARGMGYQFVQA